MMGKLVITASLLSLASYFPANAHQDSFTLFTGQNGALATSEVPRHCISNGVMVCHRYHPLFSGGSLKHSLEPRDKPKTVDPGQAKPPSSINGQIVKLNRAGVCLEKGDPGYRQTTSFELYFSIEKCLVRGGRKPPGRF